MMDYDYDNSKWGVPGNSGPMVGDLASLQGLGSCCVKPSLDDIEIDNWK